MGDAYFLSHDYDQAQKQYLKLLDKRSSAKFKATLYYRLSKIEYKKGDAEKAKEYLEKIQEDYPLNLDVRSNGDIELSDLPSFYSVQVGSFTKPANARGLCDKLLGQGYPAYIEEACGNGKKIYRVRVGKLNSLQEACSLEDKLSGEGHPTKIVP
ncbi:MAG: SPOR domain-containing protein [Candidatus Omnitrophica bacterium]|nr:SPOR domain-containing protein [Candidatus Omnitrophota bacterium]